MDSTQIDARAFVTQSIVLQREAVCPDEPLALLLSLECLPHLSCIGMLYDVIMLLNVMIIDLFILAL